MMSQEPHHLHHHHHHHLINEFGNPPMSSFEAAAGHDPFGVEMSANASWRGFASDQSNPAAVPGGGWPGIESSSLIRPLHTNNLQNLSLSLFNPPHPGSSFQPSSSSYHGQPFHFKASKYLLPAQDLLSEFCSLGGSSMVRNSTKLHDESTTSSVLNQQSLFSLEPLELQKRKAKLLSMLEEVDRRYRRYCEQMKAVVSTFEEVAGEGAARTYSMLASKAMSRHFRCLRDGIAGQIKATRRAMGESEAAGAAPGLTRGETPRLKLLDQCLRQQKAFQQVGLMESHPWRPQRGLPERSVSILRSWLFEHFLHP
ncbi:BEL1-like homeodomain protein 4 [Apostasia shenzhenica]|uniref:BEL1-like homeodomain protein 4 n=1 Tax=Apostasia shenzhenica TaxID=1088818 RepID=A0A2I0BEP1_9ASPA|nr:BEL1-like homeodomain protein 4 [Apostasia shenzhenica]